MFWELITTQLVQTKPKRSEELEAMLQVFKGGCKILGDEVT